MEFMKGLEDERANGRLEMLVELHVITIRTWGLVFGEVKHDRGWCGKVGHQGHRGFPIDAGERQEGDVIRLGSSSPKQEVEVGECLQNI